MFVKTGYTKTLFWYVFLNLLKVFGLASGVIAGIMSFGGLLKPLMDNGLNIGQAGRMLGYAMWAMTSYSYPIAALFACTVVYGRLASDNEVTAFRAAGISLGPLGLGFPAAVLGVIVSLLSLLMLSFVVPWASLGMERTVVSNLGQLVVNRITQSHQIQLYQAGSAPLTIFARSAEMKPTQPGDDPKDQVVRLQDVSIVTFDKASADKRLAVPEEFYLAKVAEAHIRQAADLDSDANPIELTVVMSEGLKFPRQTMNRQEAAMQGGIQTEQFGPFPMQSPLRENTKFMSVARLHDLELNPEKSRRMQTSLQDLIRADQQTDYLKDLINRLTVTGYVEFTTVGGDHYTLQPPPGLTPTMDRTKLTLTTPASQPEGVQFTQQAGGGIDKSRTWTAREVRIRAYPDNELQRLSLAVELQDTTLHVEGDLERREAPRTSLERDFTVAMPPAIAAITQRTVRTYIGRFKDQPTAASQLLRRNLIKQDNSVVSELHSRVSFALSCVVLTLVGYGLGVAFKSGNYLNAFAVSVVPAIISIVLVVTGQHICENVPMNIVKGFNNPLHLGLTTIWTGNVLVLLLAIVLMVRLRRT